MEHPHCLERSTEWSLDQGMVNLLLDLWVVPMVDLFATRLKNKVGAFYSHLPDPLAWIGLRVSCTCPPFATPVPCSAQGNSEGDSSNSHHSVVASKRVVSPGSAAASQPAGVATRRRWSFHQGKQDVPPKHPPSHLETLETLCR